MTLSSTGRIDIGRLPARQSNRRFSVLSLILISTVGCIVGHYGLASYLKSVGDPTGTSIGSGLGGSIAAIGWLLFRFVLRFLQR